MILNMCINGMNISFPILLSFIDIKPEVIRYEMCSMVSYYSALVTMFAVTITCGQHLFNTKHIPNLCSSV